MTYEEKIQKAEEKEIFVLYDKKKLNKDNIVGIYKFFKIKDAEKHCFYIGKSTSIASRLFGSSQGHIYMFLKNDYSKLVPSKIAEYLDDGYKIQVEIKEIDYRDTSFSKAAHRLALEELKQIVDYQNIGQCEFQKPEGANTYQEKFWEENYKIK